MENAAVSTVSNAASISTTDTCANVTKDSIGGILNFFSCTLLQSVVPLLYTLATVAFIWGIIQYFLYPDNEAKRKNGKTYMVWGLVALFVMISMWGIVQIFSTTFGTKTFIPQLSQPLQ